MINVHSNESIQYDGPVPYCYLQDSKQNDVATIEIDETIVTIYCIHHDDSQRIDLNQYDNDEALWCDVLNEALQQFGWIADNDVIDAIIGAIQRSVAT